LLQEEGEVPSDEFLLYLGKHLKAKKRQVPFIMPQEEKSAKEKNAENLSVKVKPTKNEVTNQIDSLIADGKASKAMDVAISAIQGGVTPKTVALRYLLKTLAENGNIEKIEALNKYLTDSAKRNISYDDKLTLAKFNKGLGTQHVDELLQMVQSANSPQEMEMVVQKFPRSKALSSAVQDDELFHKC
jgi:hypothetical protein